MFAADIVAVVERGVAHRKLADVLVGQHRLAVVHMFVVVGTAPEARKVEAADTQAGSRLEFAVADSLELVAVVGRLLLRLF